MTREKVRNGKSFDVGEGLILVENMAREKQVSASC